MIMRVASIDDKQYELCLEYGLWGDEKSSIKRWNSGDLLLFKVNNEVKSIVRITGSCFEDDLLIWDNGYYRYRIPFQMIKEFDKEKRKLLSEEFKEKMITEYGKKYGWVILNKQPIKSEIAEYIFNY
ncbi:MULTISPECIES: hypothetical protein [Dehalobacter]|uniref:ASCH domain-containing protein n=1 Tax=Dehalobacter restrictus TaxID=55583 RepID=A0A857DLP4_9FIRM|nr:hypothetical protein [Dehalobacter restrictus]QHA01056.1 hypothetical protein GQ588_10645 [Dehalobacter restrictus]UWG95969.1 hypothetical protein LPY66_13755 [Dehalobacter sp. DCM]